MLQTALTNEEFKCLDMHEQLSLVIICSTGIDSSVTNLRLERIRMPKLDRIDRLDIIMSIYKNCRKRGINNLLTEHYRMTGCRINRSLIGTGLQKKFHKSVCATLHIRLMLLKRAHRRNPQQ